MIPTSLSFSGIILDPLARDRAMSAHLPPTEATHREKQTIYRGAAADLSDSSTLCEKCASWRTPASRRKWCPTVSFVVDGTPVGHLGVRLPIRS